MKIMWIRKLKQTKHNWKNVALVTYPFIEDIDKCGPNLYCRKAKSNLFRKHVLRLIDYFITELNPQILASFLLNRCYITNESKLETKLFRTHNGLKRVSTILQILLETAVTWRWNGYRNKSQHRKLTLKKKIIPPILSITSPAL